MGAIQGAINSMLSTAGAAASVVKGIGLTQEMAAKKAMESATREVQFKIKQQQLKNTKIATKLLKAKVQKEKGGKK